MCGIVYSQSFNGQPVIGTIKKRFNGQRERGVSGFGFFLPQENKLTHNTQEGRIMRLLDRHEKTTEVLFHHRIPTNTGNVRNGCHPYSTKDFFENNYVLVHNGVLQNAEKLKKKHEALGIKYVSLQEDGKTFNDSEALAYEMALFLEGKQEGIEAIGSIAFICTKRDSKGKPVAVFFGRNVGNPLVMKLTDKSLTLSSKGEGDVVPINELHTYLYETGEVFKQEVTFPYSSYRQSASQGYGGQTSFSRNRGASSPPKAVGAGSKYTPPSSTAPASSPALGETTAGLEDDDEYWERLADSQMIQDAAIEELRKDKWDYAETVSRMMQEKVKLEDAVQVIDDKLDADPPYDTNNEEINLYCEMQDRIELLKEIIKYCFRRAPNNTDWTKLNKED